MGVVRPVGGVTVNGIVMIYVMSTECAWVVVFICCCFCLLLLYVIVDCSLTIGSSWV